jgi:hypothetical protein
MLNLSRYFHCSNDRKNQIGKSEERKFKWLYNFDNATEENVLN